jgi:hypothetical protein
MKPLSRALISLGIVLLATSVYARNVKYLLPINAALQNKDAEERPTGDKKFFFGKEESPAIATQLRNDSAYGKASIRNRSDEDACNRAFLSALVALERRAKQLGGNAVVNITSFFKKGAETSSATEFECHAGASAGVGLRGDIVVLKLH